MKNKVKSIDLGKETILVEKNVIDALAEVFGDVYKEEITWEEGDYFTTNEERKLFVCGFRDAWFKFSRGNDLLKRSYRQFLSSDRYSELLKRDQKICKKRKIDKVIEK